MTEALREWFDACKSYSITFPMSVRKNLRCKMFNSQTQESLQIPNANLSNVLNLLRRRIMIFYILCIILLPYRLCFDIIIYYDLFYLN